MNKVYEVKYKKYSTDYVITVLAKSIGDAFEKTTRYLKKQYYGDADILSIEFVLKIDVIYKS